MVRSGSNALVNRYCTSEQAEGWLEKIGSFPAVRLNARQLSDAQMIAQGAFSPLEGFMARLDYLSMLKDMHLSSGAPWSLPVTLAVDGKQATALKEGKEVALLDPEGAPVGVLELEEKYTYDKTEEAQRVYRTADQAHPGVANLYGQGEVLLGGRVWMLRPLALDEVFQSRYMPPKETRAAFESRGWKTVVGFQTRNPVHRAHEYIQKCALEIVDGLLLHPLVGETKGDDIPAPLRMRCYEALLEGYYPKDRVVLSVLPAFMRYAGPREAIFHALVRKNYGCTHFIVGRDHAGVGSYYGPYDAQHIFSEFGAGELGITPLFFENTFFCKSCAGMASKKSCPHSADNHVTLSGTQVRQMLTKGQMPPGEFTRPEVAHILAEAYSAVGSRT